MFAVCTVPKGSGLLSTPGDLTPPSRLVHASTLTYFADPVKTSDEAVNLAIHILNTVDIPHGVVSKDYTNWIVAKDLTYNALYYCTYNDLTVKRDTSRQGKATGEKAQAHAVDTGREL